MNEQALEQRRPVTGPPFDAAFFAAVLDDRVRDTCATDTEGVPGVLLYLADGSKVELCQILAIQPTWMVALIFRDRERREDTETAFVPYGLITRVSVTLERSRPRAMGFRVAAHAGAAAAS